MVFAGRARTNTKAGSVNSRQFPSLSDNSPDLNPDPVEQFNCLLKESAAISSRKVLEMEWEHIKARFGAGKVPLPSFWGGFRVKPETIEFWQVGPSRLHDHFQYTRQPDESWTIDRLAP